MVLKVKFVNDVIVMSRPFRLRLEFYRARAKRLPRAKKQLSVPGSILNQYVADKYIVLG